MLKECGEEKARGTLHPKCKNERKKGSSLPSLHYFFFFMVFFLCYFFFLLLEKKKMPRENVTNKKAKAGAKSDKVEREFEGKFLPFSCYFLLFSFMFCFLCV